MTDIENRGAGSFDDIEVREVPVLECAYCGLLQCGHSGQMRVRKTDATAKADHSLDAKVTRYVADRKPL
jgi:hypothetical protein